MFTLTARRFIIGRYVTFLRSVGEMQAVALAYESVERPCARVELDAVRTGRGEPDYCR